MRSRRSRACPHSNNRRTPVVLSRNNQRWLCGVSMTLEMFLYCSVYGFGLWIYTDISTLQSLYSVDNTLTKRKSIKSSPYLFIIQSTTSIGCEAIGDGGSHQVRGVHGWFRTGQERVYTEKAEEQRTYLAQLKGDCVVCLRCFKYVFIVQFVLSILISTSWSLNLVVSSHSLVHHTTDYLHRVQRCWRPWILPRHRYTNMRPKQTRACPR